MKSVCVVGLGYVGLPTASLLASKGFQVHGVDTNTEIVKTIESGNIHIVEPELDILVRSAVNSGNLTVSTKPVPADVFILAVPTPFVGDHVPDVSYIDAATEAISPFLNSRNLVILESTSPVGTTERIAAALESLRPDIYQEGKIYVAHCPERVLPGQILRELVSNDRIIGGINSDSTQVASEFYYQFVSGEIICTNSKTAELSKLTENSFRDVNIAFANELSLICDQLELNVWELIELANRHPRVSILQPGPGVGGHCIAVDPWFIVSSAPQKAKLIRTARQVNDSKPGYVVDKVKEKANRFKNPVVACLGLSYKANIDDVRESPAIGIVEELCQSNIGKILVVEPFLSSLPQPLKNFQNIELVDLAIALKKADILLLLVDHRTFYQIDRASLKEKIVLDTRGIWR